MSEGMGDTDGGFFPFEDGPRWIVCSTCQGTGEMPRWLRMYTETGHLPMKPLWKVLLGW